MLLELQLRQLGAQHLHGVVPVLELAALRLAEHHNARGQVGQPHGGGGLVDVLTACAGGTARLHFNVLRTDLDLAVVLQLRHDLQRGEAGLPPCVGVKGADAHQTVYAVLTLEIAVGVLTFDEDGGGLDARLVTGLVVHQLIGIAVPLCPAGVHPVQHLRPVLRLGAAGTGVERQNGVVAVVLAGQQSRQPPLTDLLLQRLVAVGHFLQLAGVVLLLRHFAQGQRVLPLGNQLVVLLDLVFQPLHLPAHLLAPLQIVPEALLLRLLLELGKLLPRLGDAQCLFQLAQRRLQSQQLLLILVVLNNCHISCLLASANFLSLSIIAKIGHL